MVAVLMLSITDFIGFLLVVCVFEFSVRAELFILALDACVFLARACRVIVNACQILLCVRVCVRFLCMFSCVRDLMDPAPEAADSSVERGRRGAGAAVTPGNDPDEDPSARLRLAHQPASGVALTTVVMQEAGVRRTACTQGAVAGEAVAVALLALP